MIEDEKERGWSIITIEGYCGIDWDYIETCSPHYYKFNGEKEPDKWEKEPNPNYDPEAKIPNDPPYCEKHICFACLSNKCPYFAYAEYKGINEEELEWMGDELDDYADAFQRAKS